MFALFERSKALSTFLMLEGKQKKEYVGSNSSDERLFNFEASSPFSLLVNVLLYARLSGSPTHMSGRNIWIFFEAPQQYIRHINPWKKCSNLM